MTLRQTLSSTLFFFFFMLSLNAQDASYSQVDNTPLQVNSALTGDFDGKARVYSNYRHQWTSALSSRAFRTLALSADSRITIGESSYVGVGFTSMFDYAGELDYGTNQFRLQSSYAKILGDKNASYHVVGIGLGIGVSRNRFDEDKVRWPVGQVPTDLISKKDYFDMTTGLFWKYTTQSRFSFLVGSSIDHLTRPNIAFTPTIVERLYREINVHGSVEIPLSKKFSLIPSFLFTSQGPQEATLVGLESKYFYKTDSRYNPFSSLRFGVFARAGLDYKGERGLSSLVGILTLEANSFLIGLSYDTYSGRYRQSNFGSSATEISVAYRFGVKKG